jgi:hypothetical protein
MRTEYFAVLSSLLLAPLAATAAELHPMQLVDNDQVGPLTLTGAKQIVARSLLETGQRMVRVGGAEFDGDGNVLVEIVTIQGVPLRHVLVDGRTRQFAAVKTRGSDKG